MLKFPWTKANSSEKAVGFCRLERYENGEGGRLVRKQDRERSRLNTTHGWFRDLASALLNFADKRLTTN